VEGGAHPTTGLQKEGARAKKKNAGKSLVEKKQRAKRNYTTQASEQRVGHRPKKA